MLHFARLERITVYKHSNLLDPFICCKENKVSVNGATILNITSVSVTTFSVTTPSVMTFSITINKMPPEA